MGGSVESVQNSKIVLKCNYIYSLKDYNVKVKSDFFLLLHPPAAVLLSSFAHLYILFQKTIF